MFRLYRTWALAAVAAAVLGIGLSAVLGGALGAQAATGASPSAMTPPAISASNAFGCRASVVRATLAGTSLAEPAVANAADSPCTDDSALVQSTGLLGSSPVNLGTVGPAGAYTYETGTLDGSGTPGATSVAEVDALNLTVGGYTISIAGPAEAQAAVECVGTTLSSSYSSNLNALTITGPGLPAGGQTIEIGGAVNQVVTGLPAALNALVSIKANVLTQSPATNSLTAQLLDISLLSIGATPAANVVVGEAVASYADAGICQNNVPNTVTSTTTVTTGTNGMPTTITKPTTVTQPGSVTVITGANGVATTVTTSTTVVEPGGAAPAILADCTTGSVLDSSNGDCVIYDGAGADFVSKPFKGPSGGTVETLAAARSRYKSACLSGAGPRWVMVVTSNGGAASGTPTSDRILGLGKGERISGLAGNDCIDAHGANAKVKDGNGKDRIYVSTGTNRVIAGNGNNVIHGGNGKDWITDGTGKDYIYGGRLASRIDAYGNEKHIYGGPANDRIWTNASVAYVSCGRGKANLLYGRRGTVAYGRKHGCEKTSVLK